MRRCSNPPDTVACDGIAQLPGSYAPYAPLYECQWDGKPALKSSSTTVRHAGESGGGVAGVVVGAGVGAGVGAAVGMVVGRGVGVAAGAGDGGAGEALVGAA